MSALSNKLAQLAGIDNAGRYGACTEHTYLNLERSFSVQIWPLSRKRAKVQIDSKFEMIYRNLILKCAIWRAYGEFIPHKGVDLYTYHFILE